MIQLPIGDFELGIGVFRIGDWGFPESLKHQFPIQNHQLVNLSPIIQFITNWLFPLLVL